MFFVTYRTEFAAAHQLRHYRGATEPLHGHNFRVEVVVRGEELDEAGMLIDFLDLRDAVQGALERLEHRHLNELPEFHERGGASPSAENVARHLYREVSKTLPARARMDAVTVFETDRCSATYREG